MTTTQLVRKPNLAPVLWLVVSALMLPIPFLALPLFYANNRADAARLFAADLPRLGLTPDSYAAYLFGLSVVSVGVAYLLAIIIFLRRSRDTTALLIAFGFSGALTNLRFNTRLVVNAYPDFWPLFVLASAVALTAIVIALLTFPDSRYVPGQSKKWLIPLFLFNLVISYFRLANNTISEAFIALFFVTGPVLGVIAQVQRYRYKATPTQRQQTKWALYGIIVTVLGLTLFVLIDLPLTPYLTQHSFIRLLYRLLVNTLLLNLPITFLPISIAIAITRYRLWQIDLLINRSIVYASLSLLITSFFGLALLLLQTLIGVLGVASDDLALLPLLLAAVAAGLFFNPIRRGVQTIIDRRFYRWRFDLNQLAAAHKQASRQSLGLLSQQTIDGYQVQEVVGRGGMGEVYRATRGGQVVALKVLRVDEANTQLQQMRFQREIAALRQLNHPNIVRFYQAGEANLANEKLPYVAIEYVNSVDLSTVIRQRGRFAVADARRLLQGLCLAIDHIHSNGIVHRDLKPHNVMLRIDDDRERLEPVLMDFGIAKLIRGDSITDSNAIGTIGYMAPEQIQTARDVDHRADIYALGILLYEMLTGQVPFQGSVGQILFAHLQQTPPSMASLVTGIPTAYESAVSKALSKDPALRWQSAGQFLAALPE
jgi:tRNA A-37 threonylcarbamoyl transferase component Bud32